MPEIPFRDLPDTAVRLKSDSTGEPVTEQLLRASLCGVAAPFWILVQTPEKLFFDVRRTIDSTLPVSSSSAGRVFNADTEVRWLAAGDGAFNVWTLSEDPSGTPSHMRSFTNVYLNGAWNEGAFREKNFLDPLDRHYAWFTADRSPLSEDDRLCLRVAEYGPLEPNADISLEDFESELNKPRVVAHRLCGVEARQDSDSSLPPDEGEEK